MFTSKPPTCTGRTLDSPRKDRDIRYLRHLGNSDIAESFNGKLRDELLDREIFYTLTEAKILIERWRREYNKVRPHSALGYRPPAPEVVMPATVDGLHMSFALS